MISDKMIYLYYMKDYNTIESSLCDIEYFYRKRPDYKLMAFTDKKAYAKKFKNIRNMDKIIEEKVNMDYESYKDMIDNLPNLSMELVEFKCYDKEDGSIATKEIPLTILEKNLFRCEKSTIEVKLYNMCWNSLGIFNKDVKKALKILGYNKLHKELTDRSIFNIGKMDFSNMGFLIDDISILYSIIGESL